MHVPPCLSSRVTTIFLVSENVGLLHHIFPVTGEILKCIVIVDTLHRIEIETTTRLLYLEDSPEELMVRGYDQEGSQYNNLIFYDHSLLSYDINSLITTGQIFTYIYLFSFTLVHIITTNQPLITGYNQ